MDHARLERAPAASNFQRDASHSAHGSQPFELSLYALKLSAMGGDLLFPAAGPGFAKRFSQL